MLEPKLCSASFYIAYAPSVWIWNIGVRPQERLLKVAALSLSLSLGTVGDEGPVHPGEYQRDRGESRVL